MKILDELNVPEPARLALHYLALEIVCKHGEELALQIAQRYERQAGSMFDLRPRPDSELGDGERVIAAVLRYEVECRREMRRIYQRPDPAAAA